MVCILLVTFILIMHVTYLNFHVYQILHVVPNDVRGPHHYVHRWERGLALVCK